ncbi:hypothetical protein PRK78_001779 [Emydomyces testavorans]|uniref:WD repeat protein n=1 Tax=Emydomyces testavorans TaxID=2070801 RepID=A0AAF0IH72_9EURO|nr:hypothetical protein PRK78_001779 [Emydomyces testavorans]
MSHRGVDNVLVKNQSPEVALGDQSAHPQLSGMQSSVQTHTKVHRRSPMKARRGGLSLGAGFRAAQSERSLNAVAETGERNGQPDSRRLNEKLRTTEDPRQTDLTSPERDDLDEFDLDVRAQLLLNKFIPHHLQKQDNPRKAKEHDLPQPPSNPLKRRADSISRDTESYEANLPNPLSEIKHFVRAPVLTATSVAQESPKNPEGFSSVSEAQLSMNGARSPNGPPFIEADPLISVEKTNAEISEKAPGKIFERMEPAAPVTSPERRPPGEQKGTTKLLSRSRFPNVDASFAKQNRTVRFLCPKPCRVNQPVTNKPDLRWINVLPSQSKKPRKTHDGKCKSLSMETARVEPDKPKELFSSQLPCSPPPSNTPSSEKWEEAPDRACSAPCVMKIPTGKPAGIVELSPPLSSAPEAVSTESAEKIEVSQSLSRLSGSSSSKSGKSSELLHAPRFDQNERTIQPSKAIELKSHLLLPHGKVSNAELDTSFKRIHLSSANSISVDKKSSGKQGEKLENLKSSSDVRIIERKLENGESTGRATQSTNLQGNFRSVSPPTTSASTHRDSVPKGITGQYASKFSGTNTTPPSFPTRLDKIAQGTTSLAKIGKPSIEAEQPNKLAVFSILPNGSCQNNTLHGDILQDESKSPMSRPRKSNLGTASFKSNLTFDNQDSLVRRSRRNRNAPVNYYAPRPGFYGGLAEEFHEPGSDDPTADMPTPESPTKIESPPNQLAPKHTSHQKVIYQSSDFHIIQEPLVSETARSIAEAAGKSHVPYCDQAAKDKLSKFAGNDGIVHVDFDPSELHAIYVLLAGNESSIAHEVPIQALVSQAAIRYRKKGADLDALGRRLHYLRILKRQLQNHEKGVDVLVELKCGTFTGSNDVKRKKIEKISKCLTKIFNLELKRNHGDSLATLRAILKEVKVDWLYKLGTQCQYADALVYRDRDDIRRFLKDAQDEALSPFPSFLHIVRGVSECHLHFDSNDTSALLRSRELGYSTHRNRTRISRRLDDSRKWELWKSWTGASNDVLVLSWSPDSTRFVAGAAAQTDDHNMQYNRNNNLLLGNLRSSKLKELPDHRIQRPLLESGPNSHSTYVMVDPNLYMTVNAAHWTSCGNHLYTASFDQTVKLWDVSSHENAKCVNTQSHPGKVQEMAVSKFDNQLVATGCDGPSFYLCRVEDNAFCQPVELTFRRDKCSRMTPSSLQWGLTPQTNNMLVGGMTGEDSINSHDPSRNGYLSLWRVDEASVTTLHVTPNTQNIFDVAWHPSLSILATGCTVPFSARTHGYGSDVRSLVRIYEPLNSKCVTQSYDCPALDINQVTFCPVDNNYITASCTDGVTYVWDYRNPKRILHKLKHGGPISDANPDLTREQADVGVRCSLWGKGFDFYTGASDGVVKRWDIRLASEDVLRENVASFDQELMCASISPDYTNMILGDASGGIHVISTAPWGRSNNDFSTFDLERALEPEPKNATDDPSTELSREVEKWVSSGKLLRHPIFGYGQGPNYNGAHTLWECPENTSFYTGTFRPLKPEERATQLEGPPPCDRPELDEVAREKLAQRIQLSIVRNQQRSKNKRKRGITISSNPRRSASFQSQTTPSSSRKANGFAKFNSTTARNMQQSLPTTPSVSKSRQVNSTPFKIDPANFIDLTLDSDEDSVQEIKPPGQNRNEDEDKYTVKSKLSNCEDDDLEEDYWWPIEC